MNRIKELRLSLDLTQAELAQKIGFNQTAIGKYERNELEPSVSTLIKLADIFNVSTDYLIGRSDDFGNVTIVGQTERPLAREERTVVELFRKLPEDLKKRATAYLEKLSDLADEDGSVSSPVRKS